MTFRQLYDGLTTDVHGIPMRLATLEGTLAGKLRAAGDPQRRASMRQRNLADILRLVEAHPELA
jgi:hypothetical protein